MRGFETIPGMDHDNIFIVESRNKSGKFFNLCFKGWPHLKEVWAFVKQDVPGSQRRNNRNPPFLTIFCHQAQIMCICRTNDKVHLI